MDVKQLREVIEDALTSIVGTYTLPNNTTLPAFYVDGQYGVPKDWKIQGLEVVIQEFPTPNPRACVGTGLERKFWTVIMTDYQPASRSLLDAINALKKRFPDGEYRFRAENETVYGQCLVNIPDFDIFFLR
tara:strand:+ start:88 stop:480 length:393 start_codon:yes stop_codon:yes gene_type:complete